MKVNSRGQIIGEEGLLWLRSGDGYFADGCGYEIRPDRDDPLKWELVKPNDAKFGVFTGSTGDVYIFRSYSLYDCQRAAEIHRVRRGLL